jgi:23S rRNA (cytidine1920-2'-O)/16S rRNA (cytidine1409-2'-O)-methyltransferase
MTIPDRPPTGRLNARVRLDELLVARGLAGSRNQAQVVILAGRVRSGDDLLDKPGKLVRPDSPISVDGGPRYVSRGGNKLEAALVSFGVSPYGLVCADIGASTGGFTDCLLQRGAHRVYAIDVGYGQLAWSLRSDPRVIVLERTNIRYLDALPEPVYLASIDVSFIGLDLVLPAVARLLAPGGQVIALVKPQFEAGKGNVGKGGVVRDPDVHRSVLERVLGARVPGGLSAAGLVRSPITGPAGNVEFLVWLRSGAPPSEAEVETWIEAVLAQPAIPPGGTGA